MNLVKKDRDIRSVGDFDILTPDVMISAVEKEFNLSMTGLAISMPSYINRVYELQTKEGERLIAKFYRPGRWSLDALQDEHNFMLDCASEEIPLVPPIKVPNGGTIAKSDGIYFALFEKRSGREFDIKSNEDWKRLGNIVARIHLAGSERDAPHRLRLHPITATQVEIDHLIKSDFISKDLRNEFKSVCYEILDTISRPPSFILRGKIKSPNRIPY